MSKRNRVSRPKDELKREFVEQLQLLRHSCEVFDSGLEAVGKHIALSLRVFVHDHGQSRSLLGQLGLGSITFFDSSGPLNPRNLLSEHKLVALQMTTSRARYVAMVSLGLPPISMRRVRFQDWWNDPVLKDGSGRTFCRRELVLHIADTDGGAHVDPQLDEAYMALSRQNSLGWTFRAGDIVQALAGRPELACIRQIAHEFLCTINALVPEFSVHAQPVIPSQPRAT